ncbi:helix-turn-helix domain-containing protein, partial [Acinetobacter baumannii]
IAERERGLTTSEVSRRLGIPKSSASYILHTLEQRGYLKRQASTRRYQLSLKLLNITRHLLADLDIRELARPTLRELVDQSGLTA